jgi:peptide/nickel transport system ATP-binding protein
MQDRSLFIADGDLAARSETSSALLEIDGLTIDFPAGRGHVRALHRLDLVINRGEAVGMVGESGSGKSITWLAALGLLDPAVQVGGQIRLAGRDILGLPERALARVRGKRIAMIFQDPSVSLNPVHRIGRQITESLVLHRGMSGAPARAEARRLLERVQIANAAERLEAYPHELSGGMCQRVMIALALAGEPDLLVADEPTTALDVTIQAQILELLKETRRETGMALVIISHDLGVVAELADRVAVMYAGRIVEEAPVQRIFEAPAHPYTQGLIAALPELRGPRQRLTAIPGQVPEPTRLPRGCAFGPRCVLRLEACDASLPAPILVAHGHRSACLRAAPTVDAGASAEPARAVA